MPRFNIYLFLLAFYIISCLWIIVRFYKRDKGVFQAPFIFSLASMLMMVPQFCVIIYNPRYDPNLLFDLTYCMITSTLALAFGWDKAQTKKIYRFTDINLHKSKITFFILFLIGLYCAFKSYGEALNNIAAGGEDIRKNHAYQILTFFMLYFDIGMFYALTYIIKKEKPSHIIKIIIIISCIYYLFIVLMFARRALVVKLFMSLGLLLVYVRPKWQQIIKVVILVFFTFGTIYSASIGEIRGNLQSKEDETINIWENYKKSYISPPMEMGMDLGNGALCIQYTKENSTYNFGTFLWDDIVTWYFPSFLFGKEGKESLKLAGENNKYIERITHNITTTTGYYQAFSAFSYFGFILFYGIGYLMGFIWKRSYHSSLYLIIYLCFMYNIPNLASHGFSYILNPLETFVVFSIPIIYRFFYKKRRYQYPLS